MSLTLLRPAEPPLDPSPDEARSELRRELLDPEYHEQDLLQRFLTWVDRQIGRTLEAASDAPPLSVVVSTLIFLLLALALAWLVSRARLTRRRAADPGAVLTDERVSAAELRARAEAALAEGRPEDAVVDGFRALALRQVERGLLEDRPGATAAEVAATLPAEHPRLATDVRGCARLFDLVRYGERPATREQAAQVLRLDDELAGVR